MKGWVYVISNRAMPELVKVGFSTKDPELRASELSHTGSPHQYLVEYDLLVEAPYDVEQQVHRALRHRREAKEWFRCSPAEAVAAIKSVAGSSGLHETYKGAERSKVEAIRTARVEEAGSAQARVVQEAANRKREELEAASTRALKLQELQRKIAVEEAQLREYWRSEMKARHQLRPLRNDIIWGAASGCVGVAALIFSIGAPPARDWQLVLAIGILGAILGVIFGVVLIPEIFGDEKSLKKRNEQIADLRAKMLTCPQCKSAVLFERESVEITALDTVWSCTNCKVPISPPWT